MITREHIRAQVDRIVGDDRASYDLDAIVAEVINEHGPVDLETIPTDDLDGIFLRHELPGPEKIDPFGSRWPGRDGRPLPAERRSPAPRRRDRVPPLEPAPDEPQVTAVSPFPLALSEAERTRYRLQAERTHDADADVWAQAGVGPGARVLEFGCGTGEVLAQLAPLVGSAGTLIGVDFDTDSLRHARATLDTTGGPETELIAAAATDPALLERFRASVDVVVLRHLLIWNGGLEADILDHAQALLRPGGAVYVSDSDLTALRYVPTIQPHAELYPAFQRYLRACGHDPQVGTKLGELLTAAGFDLEVYRGATHIMTRRPGARGPAWAARDAMRTAGTIGHDDITRWEQAFTDLDATEHQPRLFLTGYTALGRRPAN